MACLSMVDWFSLLTPASGIPSDVSFIVKESAIDEDDAVILHAHKNLLAAVSPVFRTQFFGSLPEVSRIIKVEDSTSEAFTIMLESIYQRFDASKKIENLSEICDIFDVFYLAHKFDVLGFKDKILAKLRNIPVDLSNFRELVSALDHYKHFEKACQVVEVNLKQFIIEHPSPLELVEIAKNNSSVVVKEGVLVKLSKIAEFSPLEVLKAAHDLIAPDEYKSVDSMKVLSQVMEGCIKGYEAVLKDPVLFSKFIPGPSAGLDHELNMIQRTWKENFCNNCQGAVCKNGDVVDASTVKTGTSIKVWMRGVGIGYCIKGEVSETGLSFYNKISIGGEGDFGLHSSDGCSAEEHGVTRWNDGIPSEARNCPGVHKATRCVFRVRLVNGWERTSCDHVNNEYFVNAYFTCM